MILLILVSARLEGPGEGGYRMSHECGTEGSSATIALEKAARQGQRLLGSNNIHVTK